MPFLFASNRNESDNRCDMDGKRLIEKIRLRNILSFGDKGEEITLEPLNIIIGQNASGKSNLVDVIKLLKSLHQNNGLGNHVGKSGGVSEWMWKGGNTDYIAEIEIKVNWLLSQINYVIKFSEYSNRVGIIEEEIVENSNKNKIIERYDYMNSEDSIFSPNQYGKGSYTGFAYTTILASILEPLIYSDLQTNRKSRIRYPQDISANDSFLEEDGSNLSLVLNDLEIRGETREKIIENLKKFNPKIKSYAIKIIDVVVQLFIREEGLEKPISAMRLSDGTLRYLCLLAILCHPEPPPLVCIEEPETGLHPDILPTIAELMIEASQRTQLIVTTHSDILVSAFSEIPEAILVCEKDEDGTHFRRLEADKLKVWLEEYSLGEAWLRGAIGGTRW